MKFFCLFLILALTCSIEASSLFWWRKSKTCLNFGDELSPIVVERVLEKKLPQTTRSSTRVLAIGSILHFAKNNDVIWGCGKNGKIPDDFCEFQKLDVRAVRGPKTREFLLSKGIPCPEIYGDPALLLPLLFPDLKPQPTRDFIVIPNLNEIRIFRHFSNLVVPTEDPWKVIDAILSAKLVISSSLHGLIVAEAFRIPAVYIRLSEIESLFKYEDYYLGTGRDSFFIAKSLEEAIDHGGEAPPNFDSTALLKSFPYDMFE